MRLTAAVVPSVHTVASSGPPAAEPEAAADGVMVTDPSEIQLNKNMNCAP